MSINSVKNDTISQDSITSAQQPIPPAISGYSVNGLDDTALDPAGGQTVLINGTGFQRGATVTFDGNAVAIVSWVSASQLSFTSPAKSAGTYAIYVVNTDGGTAIYLPGVIYSSLPTWTTNSGTLGSYYETQAISNTVVASGDAPITYDLYSGSLPTGASLSSGGVITGTSPADTGSTTYTFTVKASDAQLQDSTRSFSLTINTDVITWSAPANASVTTSYEYANIANVTMSATSAVGGANVTYSANALPTGLTLSGNLISGAVNTVGNTAVLLTSTGDATTRNATRTVYFDVQSDVVTWSNPSSNTSVSLDGTAYTNVLSASSAAGKSISYTANSLPTGLTLSTATISGTPTEQGTTTTLLTATAATTNRTSQRTITWTVSLADTYWKNVSLLLSGSTPTTTFINDASLNNAPLTVVGDTKSNNFSPYDGNGYYSVSHSATPDYLSVPHNSNFSLTSGQTDTFIIEGWFYFNVVTAQTSLFDKSGVNSVSFANWTIYLNASSQIQLQWGVSGTPGTATVGLLPSTFVPVAGTWYHIAFVKTSADWAVFANGTRIITYNGLNTAGDANPSALRIGYGIQGAANSAFFNGYISNVRAWRGTSGAPYSATSSTLIVPTSPLTAIAGTTLLSHQSARFIDVSSAATTITATGANIKVSSALPFTANGSYSTYGSGYFDGTGDYLTMPNTPSMYFTDAGNHTFECWVYLPNFAATYTIFWNRSGSAGWSLTVTTTGVVNFVTYEPTAKIISSSIPIVAGNWTHVALVRVSTTVTLYINGVSAGTVTNSSGVNETTQPIAIGSQNGGGPLLGYISDVRFVKGTALYTANFTPPTSLLTAVSGTQLLTLQYNGGANNNGFVDQSSFNNIITRSGNTTQGTFSPFSQNGWSFSASGDGAELYTTSYIGPATSSFTYECWVYPTVFANYKSICRSHTSGTAEFEFFCNSSGQLTVRNSAGSAVATTTTALSLNTWTHVALVRNGTALTIYIGGVSSATATFSTNITSTRLEIGCRAWNGDYDWSGYLSNFRYSVEATYTTAFTPSIVPLTALSTTKLLLNSNRFVDISSNNSVITANTGASQTWSIQAYSPFGGITNVPTSYSNFFDGSADYFTVPSGANLSGTGTSWTVQGWFYASTVGSGRPIITGASNQSSITVEVSGGYLQAYVNGNVMYTASASLVANRWYHFALVKNVSNNNTVSLYLDGTLVGTPIANFTASITAEVLYVGARPANVSYFSGYISNIQIVKGTALYTANFTVPTVPLTAVSGTSLLTCQSNAIADSSINGFVLTTSGSPKVFTFNPFGTTTITNVSYTPSVNGGSMYFDGTGDYLQTATGLIHTDITQTDYTIECWVYNRGPGAERYIFSQRGAGSGWEMRINADNTVSTFFTGGTTFTTTGTVTGNAWTHIAASRLSTTIRVFINGVQSATGTQSNGTSAYSSYGLWLGYGTSGGGLMLGYISDARIIRGQSLYNANFLTASSPSTPTSNTTYLLNGTSGGIIDYHGTNDLETVGNTQLASEDPYSGSYYSNYFDNVDADGLTLQNNAGLQFGTGDFTLELWVLSNSDYTTDIVQIKDRTTAGSWALVYQNRVIKWQSRWGNTDVVTSGSNLITVYSWNHIAVVRISGTTKIYLNGVEVGSASDSTDYSPSTSFLLAIGGSSSPYYNNYWGYISNLRVVKGTGVYTTAFTPSTTPLTAISGTSLLTCQSNKFVDNSPTNSTITPYITPQVKSINPFQQNTGKSLYFDGTGDYIDFPLAQTFSQQGAWTLEMWICPTVASNCYIYSQVTGSFLQLNLAANMTLYVDRSGVGNLITSTNPIVLGVWTYIALVSDGTTVKLYVNGAQSGSTATYSTVTASATTTRIGAYQNSGSAGTLLYNGYLKDLRITKGVARYTTTFTPPTAPLKSN